MEGVAASAFVASSPIRRERVAVGAKHLQVLLLGVHSVAVDVVNLNRDAPSRRVDLGPVAPTALVAPAVQDVVAYGL